MYLYKRQYKVDSKTKVFVTFHIKSQKIFTKVEVLKLSTLDKKSCHTKIKCDNIRQKSICT